VSDLVPMSSTSPPPPRAPWFRTVPTVAVVAAIVLVLVLVALLLRATPREADREVTVGRGDLDRAVLVVAGGADTIMVTTSDLGGGDLAVATTPDGSPARPVANVDGDRLTVRTTGVNDGGNLWDGGDTGDRADGPVEITVRLSERVRWDVVVEGGAKLLDLDFGGADLARIQIRSGQGTVVATLPPPVGALPVQLDGGAGSVEVDAPDGVPARVTLAQGAGTATLDEDRRQGVGAGTTLTTPDWPAPEGGDWIDVTATSGLGSFTLDRT
jgi:hypothetical protein